MKTLCKQSIIILISAVLLITLLVTACTPKQPTTPVPTITVEQQIATLTQSIGDLRATVDAISPKVAPVANLTASVDKLQRDLTNYTAIVTTSVTESQKANALAGAVTANLTTLQTAVNTLKTTVDAQAAIIKGMQTASVTLGTNPVNVNGLSVVFVNNNVYLTTVSDTTPAYAQLAVKITNGTPNAITNLDIIGSVKFSNSLYYLANGYPTVADAGNTNLPYNAYFNGSNAVNFEIYTTSVLSGKVYVNGPISLAKGASITLRPRVGLLATSNDTFTTTATLSLTSITYDIVP